MWCVLVQPEAYAAGGTDDIMLLGPYQSYRKAQEIVQKIEAKYPRVDEFGFGEIRAWAVEMSNLLRPVYEAIKAAA